MRNENPLYTSVLDYNDLVVHQRVERQMSIIQKYLKNNKATILDVGSFGGVLVHTLFNSGYKKLFGCDVFDSKNTINTPISFSVEDITKKTGYKTNTFDLSIASHVLEHVFDVRGALIEMKRITKKNGYILICLPLEVNISIRLKVLLKGRIGDPFTVGSHIKFFHPYDLEKELKYHNMRILEKTYSGLGYGKFDSSPIGFIMKFLANLQPKFFAGEVQYLLQNKK